MLRRVFARFKSQDTPIDRKEEKKRIIKKWVSKIGVNWCDIEDLLFWKDPRVSLAVFIIVTLFFWKFISYRLQKVGSLIIIAAFPTTISETRLRIWNYCVETFHLQPKPEDRRLGFDFDDLYEVTSNAWIELEDYYLYLLNLKHTSIAKFYLLIVSYVGLLIILLTYIPLAGLTYSIGTILYFYPVLNYLGVAGLSVEFGKKLARPFMVHWAHSHTKRKRDLGSTRRDLGYRRPITRRGSYSDIENEEFLPALDVQAADLLHAEAVPRHSNPHSSENESFDEFDLRGQFHRRAEDDHSSDYDEDTFLPSYNYGPAEEMPSISNFDSLMEPLDDEFHAGLNFNDVSALSARDVDTHSECDSGDTDQDVADISLDNIDDNWGQTSMGDQKVTKNADTYGSEIGGDPYDIDIDQEFEFLDRTELYDVTDDEINEQNVGQHYASKDVSAGVSNILGY